MAPCRGPWAAMWGTLLFSLVGSTAVASQQDHLRDVRPNVQLSEALQKRQDQLPDYAQRNLDTIRHIYDLTVYPNNVPIVKQGSSQVPPGLFAEHAVGRVSPVGDFAGFNDSIEYFFALAPIPSDPEFMGAAIYQADVVEFTSGCPNIAASLVYLRTAKVDPDTAKVDPSHPVSTLAQVAFWQFDESGAVERYHAWIPNLQAWITAATGADFNALLLQKLVPLILCPGIQQRCTGPYQQYADVLTCTLELELKPFGSFDEAWGDNVACRLIHLILTQVRPDVHCPHVGPTGGGKCVNIDYSVDYFSDRQLYGIPEGSVFTCGGPLTDPNNPAAVGPFSGSDGNPLPGPANPIIPDPTQLLGPLGGVLSGILKRMPAWL